MQSSCSYYAVIMQSSCSQQAVIRQTSSSHQTVVKQSWGSHQTASLKFGIVKKKLYWQPIVCTKSRIKGVTRQNQIKMQLCVMIGTTDSHAIVSYQNLICRFHRQKCLCNCRVSLFLEKNFAQIVYVHNLNVYQTWCFTFTSSGGCQFDSSWIISKLSLSLLFNEKKL